MLKRRTLPPPDKITLRDVFQILFGLIMIPLGLAILWNTLTRGAPLPALLIGGAFIAFGVYRSLFAYGRVRWYRQNRRSRNA